MCFFICVYLSSYLNFSGHPCEMVEGNIDGAQHFWIVAKDGTIIDPTADQFNQPDGQSMPAVYVGSQPAWYKLKEVDHGA